MVVSHERGTPVGFRGRPDSVSGFRVPGFGFGVRGLGKHRHLVRVLDPDREEHVLLMLRAHLERLVCHSPPREIGVVLPT